MNGKNGQRTSGKDWIWEPTRQAIYLRDGDRCVVCDATPDPEEGVVLSLDHLEPRGGNHPTNLATVCCSCNASRRDRPLDDHWTKSAANRIRRAAARPLTKELRAAGRLRAEALRPGRFAAHRARWLNQKARAYVPQLSTEAPF